MELFFLSQVNKDWTLFLDRDGVINKKLKGDYVKKLNECEILPGVISAIKTCTSIFGRIIIVTNQQGIGKGLMTIENFTEVIDYILHEVKEGGGNIDSYYFAPQLAEENSELRKPQIGMALLAKKDFPEINFSRSIMVGDSESDMEFAKNAGMHPVFISQSQHAYAITFTSLLEFARHLPI